MPAARQNYLEWTPSRILRWAEKIGPQTAMLIEKIIATRTHPEQAYRSCLGILRLEKHYPKERLENASLRALKFGALSFKALRNLNRGTGPLGGKTTGLCSRSSRLTIISAAAIITTKRSR